MARLSQDTLRAVQRYGPLVERLARKRYGVHGDQLLGRLVVGESGDRKNAVSSAGARAWTQFMPQTRQAVLRLTGGKVDPWRSADEAVHAAVLHLTGKLGNATGLEGYNPGDPSYAKYILAQRAGLPGGGTHGTAQPNSTATTPGSPIDPGQQGNTLALLTALAQPKQVAASSSLQAPSFAAGPKLAGNIPTSGGGPAPKQDTSALLDAIRTTGADVPQSSALSQSAAANGGLPADSKADAKLTGILTEANFIDKARVPYLWGGGHGAKQIRGTKVTPLDCSGAVSRALGVNPRVSGQFESWGQAGEGRNVTVYANGEHVLMKINGRFWGTSRTNPGGGAGWIDSGAIPKGYLKNFVARHPNGL